MNPAVFKFWYMVCTVFCILSLQTLVKERYEVAILAGDPNETDPLVFLICKELRSFQLKKTELPLEELSWSTISTG